MPEAVAVLKCTSSAVLLLPPLSTSIVKASVAEVPKLNETSASLASLYNFKSVPSKVSAV